MIDKGAEVWPWPYGERQGPLKQLALRERNMKECENGGNWKKIPQSEANGDDSDTIYQMNQINCSKYVLKTNESFNLQKFTFRQFISLDRSLEKLKNSYTCPAIFPHILVKIYPAEISFLRVYQY